ncbi:DUF721 domain-containing protein [Streptomyces sp. NPDC087862]
MKGGEVSGVDLARVALRAAREAARKNDAVQKAKKRPRTATMVRRDGREPMGLGTAIGTLVASRAWEIPAIGASLRERWAAIAPDLAGHVAAVRFDPDSGQLTVCPESSAWATKARLEQTFVIAAANKAAGRIVVSSLRILPPGAVPAPGPADVAPADPVPVAPTSPARTGETACGGYRRALEAHRAVAQPSRVDPGIAQAVERQTAALRELSRSAFPEPPAVPNNAPAPIEQARAQHRHQAAATEAAALRRARAVKDGHQLQPQRQRLERTA